VDALRVYERGPERVLSDFWVPSCAKKKPKKKRRRIKRKKKLVARRSRGRRACEGTCLSGFQVVHEVLAHAVMDDDMDVDMEDCYDDGGGGVGGGGGGGGGFFHDAHDDDDAMEWDAELVEVALHSLFALRRDPSLAPSDGAAAAAITAAAVPSHHHPSSRQQPQQPNSRDLLNTPDAMLSADGAVMATAATTTAEGGQAMHLPPLPPLQPLHDGTTAAGVPYYAVTVVLGGAV
jgi:hypothetical protein